MLPCRPITISRTVGLAASVVNMPGAKPNCLAMASSVPCVLASMSVSSGVVRRDMVVVLRSVSVWAIWPTCREHDAEWVVKPNLCSRWAAEPNLRGRVVTCR